MIARFASAVFVVAALLPGCGFHLRGTDLAQSFQTAHVNSARDVSIDDELTRDLGFAGLQVVDDAAAADVVIDLGAQIERRRTVSVTQRARTAEYELTLEVRYRIVGRTADAPPDEAKAVLVDERSARAVRTYLIDRGNIVGSSEEEALLRSEMEQELAQQILRSLAASARYRQTSPG